MVPCRWGQNALLTDAVKINGKSVGWFIIDTGAQASAIHTPVAKKLGLPIAGRGTLNGVPCPLYALKDIKIADFRITQHFIFSFNMESLRKQTTINLVGLIGGDVLGKTPFSIDPRNKTLTYHRRPSFSPPEDAAIEINKLDLFKGDTAIMRVNPHMGCPLIKIKVDGVEAIALMDTGAGATSLDPRFTSRHKQFVSERRYFDVPAVLGPQAHVAFKARFKQLTLAGQTITRPPKAFAYVGTDAPSSPIDLTIGMDVMKHFQWWFDYRNKKIWARWHPYPSVQERLAQGLDPDATDLAGRSLLKIAARNGRLEDFSALLKAGADITVRNASGFTLVHEAIQGGNLDLLKAALAAPESPGPNARGNRNITPLMWAAKYNEPDMVTLLLKKGADVNAVADKDFTALHFAAFEDHLACLQLIAAAGADPNRYNKDGITPLGFAVYHGNTRAAKTLLKAGAHWQVTDAKRVPHSAYHIAAQEGRGRIIRMIHDSKAPKKPFIESLDSKSRTPLVVAILNNHPEAVAALLEIGADPHASYRGPVTVLDLARTSKNPRIRKLVEEAAAKKGD